MINAELLQKYSRDDKGLGELFADINKDLCRYNITTKTWFFFNGKFWEDDIGSMKVSRVAKELYDSICKCDLKLLNKEDITFYSKLGNLRNRKIMIEDARDKYHISSDMLDSDQYLFNCQNGTFNLKTFELQRHNPNDLISRISNVTYSENVTSTLFREFIDTVLENDIEKIRYIQKLLGYSLTGNTCLEEFYILYGPTTRNGKSTLLESFSYALGNAKGYAIPTNAESFSINNFSTGKQPSGDIARLKGFRFINIDEIPENMILNVSQIKKLTGRDTITARKLYKEEFDFIPEFKLFFNVNHLPIINDTTLFDSDRVKVIKFNKHFSKSEQNQNLKNQLKSDECINEIFNWALEGLKNFNKEGALAPEIIINDTAEYQQSSDIFKNFMADCLIASSKNETAKIVYQRYKDWAYSNNYKIMNKTEFFAKLKLNHIFSQHGTVDGKTCSNVVIGYILKPQPSLY